MFIDDQYRPEGALRQTLRMIECAHVLAEANADQVALCRNGADIDAALAENKIALVLALESAPGIDASVELFSTLYRLGVRIASIAHWGRTPLADGSREDATGSRLTAPGVRALREMERLGMLFDISHLSASGVSHVLELATRPLIATHSCARAAGPPPQPHRRPDPGCGRHRRHGVRELRPGLSHRRPGQGERRPGRRPHRTHHLRGRHRHVGLGSDFIREVTADVTPPCCENADDEDPLFDFPGLAGPAGMPLVTEAMVRRGLPEEDILAVLGGNMRRLVSKYMGP